MTNNTINNVPRELLERCCKRMYDMMQGDLHEELRALLSAPAAAAADAPPENCRQRLASEGKPYPKSSCAACGQFSPKWRECDAALAAHRAKGVV